MVQKLYVFPGCFYPRQLQKSYKVSISQVWPPVIMFHWNGTYVVERGDVSQINILWCLSELCKTYTAPYNNRMRSCNIQPLKLQCRSKWRDSTPFPGFLSQYVYICINLLTRKQYILPTAYKTQCDFSAWSRAFRVIAHRLFAVDWN